MNGVVPLFEDTFKVVEVNLKYGNGGHTLTAMSDHYFELSMNFDEDMFYPVFKGIKVSVMLAVMLGQYNEIDIHRNIVKLMSILQPKGYKYCKSGYLRYDRSSEHYFSKLEIKFDGVKLLTLRGQIPILQLYPQNKVVMLFIRRDQSNSISGLNNERPNDSVNGDQGNSTTGLNNERRNDNGDAVEIIDVTGDDAVEEVARDDDDDDDDVQIIENEIPVIIIDD